MSDTESTETPVQPPRDRSWILPVVAIVATLALVGLALLLLYVRPDLFPAILMLTLASYMPITYIAYLQFRANVHKERVKEDWRLLGLDQEAGTDLDTRYRQVYSGAQFAIYVSLATVLTLLGLGFFYFRASLGFMPEMVATTMFYSFLGAYVFSAYFVYRRFCTLDLQPAVYLYITVRLLTVLAIAFVGAWQLQAVAEETPALVAIAAFLLGYFPDTGIRWLTSTVGHIFGNLFRRRERPLADVDGISLWHETRLGESGIDNVQNLATADVPELLLGTRFGAQELMHWIDQAILMANLPEDRYDELSQHGIRTISALCTLLEKSRAADGSMPAELPTIANIPPADLWALYHAADSGPNLHYVMQYWGAVKRYRTAVVASGTDRLLQERAEQAAKGRLADPRVLEQLGNAILYLGLPAKSLETLFPASPTSLIGIGRGYTQCGMYADAERLLTKAIQSDNTSAAAYSSRGLARALQDKYDQAMADFERAKRLEPDDAVTYNNEATAYIHQRKYEEALPLLDHSLELDRNYAQAYYNRGFAWRNLGKYEKAIEDFSQALRYNPHHQLAYLERGQAYLFLGKHREAIADFDDAIRLKRENAAAHANRGAAYLELHDYLRAIYDLDAAIDLEPRLTSAYRNRSRARAELGDIPGAISDLEEYLRRSPQPAPDADQVQERIKRLRESLAGRQ